MQMANHPLIVINQYTPKAFRYIRNLSCHPFNIFLDLLGSGFCSFEFLPIPTLMARFSKRRAAFFWEMCCQKMSSDSSQVTR